MSVVIRSATLADLAAINTIYNHYVRHSTSTYQTEPTTEDQRRQWFTAHSQEHFPTTVALDPASGGVVGWAALRPFHARAAYRFTVENSVYVHPDHLRRGIGRALLSDLIGRAGPLGFRSIIALISADQWPSIALHTALGFVEAGRLLGVGFKFDRWLDVVYLQKKL